MYVCTRAVGTPLSPPPPPPPHERVRRMHARSAREDKDVRRRFLPLGGRFPAWERCARVPRECVEKEGTFSLPASCASEPLPVSLELRPLSYTAWTGPVTFRQPRRSTRRGEDYERVAVGPRNVCDDCRRIAVPGVAAPRCRRAREREDDLGWPAESGTMRNCLRYAMQNLRRMCWLLLLGLPTLAAYPVPSPLVAGTSRPSAHAAVNVDCPAP